ncbi:MAG: hypothetical protein ACKO7R_15245 [Pseudanabaena sp.]
MPSFQLLVLDKLILPFSSHTVKNFNASIHMPKRFSISDLSPKGDRYYRELWFMVRSH